MALRSCQRLRLRAIFRTPHVNLRGVRQVWTWGGGRERGRRLWGGAGASLLSTIGVGVALWKYWKPQTVQCVEREFEARTKGVKAGHVIPDLPNFSLEQVGRHKTKDEGFWVTFGDGVYDITAFVDLHPGGSEQIKLAAGGALEPYWAVFAQHNEDGIREILEELRIGNVTPADRGRHKLVEREGPYVHEPPRSPILNVETQKPFIAEIPIALLANKFLTPNELFFVRNHLPVPLVDPASFVLEIGGRGVKPVRLTLEDLKTKFPHCSVTATLQCAGNRWAELAAVKPVKGLSWDTGHGGSIGNAEWVGVRLRDVLLYAGLSEESSGVEHVHLEGLDYNPLTGDRYGASIPVDKAMDPRGDCLLAFEMNGVDLPRDHGYPLRAVIPGTAGARNVKWLTRIETSGEEYGGHWQQKDYKGFSPSVDWDTVDYSTAPAIQELSVQSIISSPLEGAVVKGREVTVRGVAWSGGGRGIVRVDVSVDGGKSWHVATLGEGAGQQRRRAWAWSLWEANVPLPPQQEGQLEVCCKAVDSSYNVQPDTCAPIWNLRGALSNAWYRVHIVVKDE